jgi:hypothetical protein
MNKDDKRQTWKIDTSISHFSYDKDLQMRVHGRQSHSEKWI